MPTYEENRVWDIRAFSIHKIYNKGLFASPLNSAKILYVD